MGIDYPAMTAEDKKWQAQNDVRTLAEAEVIKGDPDRMKAASDAAEDMAKEKQEEADAMRDVAKGMMHYPSTPA